MPEEDADELPDGVPESDSLVVAEPDDEPDKDEDGLPDGDAESD